MGKNIGFVSTRFAGTDGVTLESSKWAQVIKKSGHSCFWFAGELDRNLQNSLLVPEAFFKHKENNWINDQVIGKKGRNPDVTEAIHYLRSYLKAKLYEFIKKFKIDMLIAENALTIPMHVPLGLALTEIIAETQIPTIAHHHDFYWERVRFTINAVSDYICMAFPPTLSNIEHVVINSVAKEELAHRTGISSTIIPNVLDFENPPSVDVKRTEDFRNSLGLKPDDVMILQPSRVIQRKGIEHAIELVHELRDPRYKLVISHETGDEGFEYAEWLMENAKDHGVDLRLFDAGIADPVNDGLKSPNQYSLWDIYPHADFITYPSLYEGFGNAFLEAIYFKKPMLVNRYATFVRDIEPKGFDLIVMDGFLTKKTVQKVREILESTEKREEMVNHNYEIASRYYSYSVLRKSLNSLIINFFGIDA
ncbi:MAG: glycosyltransferase family 4 protein [Desulfobacteraceae bacterium]|nr:glycosyltransferase family 4 protein [Pseudomonadota bacterium]MCG2755667.1 glycosyltransferase family 4 protein [Desulfobacteraceae bacterium]